MMPWKRSRLLKKGDQTQAIVLAAELHGNEHDLSSPGYDQVKLRLRVQFAEGDVAEIERDERRADVGHFVNPGDTLPVRYDPADHGCVELDLPAIREGRSTATGQQRTARREAIKERDEAAVAAAIRRERGIPEPSAPQPSPVASDGDSLDQLQKLVTLHEQGALTDAEFAESKQKLLSEL
jgi:hypothetical protein